MRTAHLYLALWALLPPSLQGQCPAGEAESIADLSDDYEVCDNTTAGSNSRTTYGCRLTGVNYTGNDHSYRIYFNNIGDEKNYVGFRLESRTADLALILIGPDGECVANSPDFVGAGIPEEIPAASYTPTGYYTLYVDSAEGAPAGDYCLRINGNNPQIFHLKLEKSAPADVVARPYRIAQTLSIQNVGPFPATGLRLPIETTRKIQRHSAQKSSFDLEGKLWTVDDLFFGDTAYLTLEFDISPEDTSGTTISSTATALEADHDTCGDDLSALQAETTVYRNVTLTLTVRQQSPEPSSSPPTVLAGDQGGINNLVHLITVRNDGPSHLSDLRLKTVLDLAEEVERPSSSEPDDGDSYRNDLWHIKDLAPYSEKELNLTFSVPPSALEDDRIETRIKVLNSEGTDPNPKINYKDSILELPTIIKRQVDLRIMQQPARATAVVAGNCQDAESLRRITLRESVCNRGPSNASGVVLGRFLGGSQGSPLPAEVTVPQPSTTTRGDFDEVEGTGRWTIGELPACATCETDPKRCPAAQLPSLSTVIAVGPGAGQGAVIEHSVKVERTKEPNTGVDPAPNTLTVEREVELRLDATEPPAQEVVAGKDDESSNLRYRLVLSNQGPSVAGDVQVEQTLNFPPAEPPEDGVRVDEVDPGRSQILDASSARLTWEVPELPACDGTGELTAGLTVGPAVPKGGEIRYGDFGFRANDAICGGTNRCRTSADRLDSTTIQREVTLLPSHGFSSREHVVGSDDDLFYYILVTNNGPSDSSEVIVELAGLSTPDGVDFEDRVDRGTLTDTSWTLAPLEDGDTATLTRELTVDAGTRTPSRITIDRAPSITHIAEEDQVPPFEITGDLFDEVRLRAETDFRLDLTASPVPVVAGTNLTLTLTAHNAGPSASTGATICVSLPQELTFVASPDDCDVGDEDGEDPPTCQEDEVRCGLGPLRVDQEVRVRVVAWLASSYTEAEVDEVTARLNPLEPDPSEASDTLDPVPVTIEADLALGLSDSRDPAQQGSGTLDYELTVTNLGPSDATAVELRNVQPFNLKCPSFQAAAPEPQTTSNCGYPSCNFFRCEVVWRIDDLDAGASSRRHIVTFHPNGLNPFDTTIVDEAGAKAPEYDPDPDNNTAREATTITVPSRADLAVRQSAAPDPAIAGQPLTYTITVTNKGLANVAKDVKMVDMLPGRVLLPTSQELPSGCSFNPEGSRTVECEIDSLPEGIENSLDFTITVIPLPSMDPIANHVRVEGGPKDPNDDEENPNFNNESTLETPVLAVAPLVVPYFNVDEDSSYILFMVYNTDDEEVTWRYEAIRTGETVLSEDPSLSEHGTSLIMLGQKELGSGSGHVNIHPATLTGEYFHLDAAQEAAGGALLPNLDPLRKPPTLCRRLSLGFDNGERFEETDFLFFVPGNFEEGEPIAVGRVYSTDGQFVQESEVSAPATSEPGEDPTPVVVIRRNSGKGPLDEGYLDLLARSGTVEWTFRDGHFGHVSAIFRNADTAVAVPAFCVEPLAAAESANDQGPAPRLLLPYFDTTEGETSFAVRNSSRDPVSVRHRYISTDGALLREDCLEIPAHGTDLVSLKERLEEQSGYVEITAVTDVEGCEPGDDGPVLHGEWVHQKGGIAHGDLLVDTRDTLMPPNLCRNWSSLFFNGASNVYTRFFFYVEEGVVPSGLLYKQSGGRGSPIVLTPEVEARIAGQRAFVLTVQDLQIPRSVKLGTIEWDFGERDVGEDVRGHVTTVHQADTTYSVAVPAVCRDAVAQGH